MKPAARRNEDNFTFDICEVLTCEQCPIREDCDTYQQQRFEEREEIYRATMMEYFGEDAPFF